MSLFPQMRDNQPLMLCDFAFVMDLKSKKMVFDLNATWTQVNKHWHQTLTIIQICSFTFPQKVSVGARLTVWSSHETKLYIWKEMSFKVFHFVFISISKLFLRVSIRGFLFLPLDGLFSQIVFLNSTWAELHFWRKPSFSWPLLIKLTLRSHLWWVFSFTINAQAQQDLFVL